MSVMVRQLLFLHDRTLRLPRKWVPMHGTLYDGDDPSLVAYAPIILPAIALFLRQSPVDLIAVFNSTAVPQQPTHPRPWYPSRNVVDLLPATDGRRPHPIAKLKFGAQLHADLMPHPFPSSPKIKVHPLRKTPDSKPNRKTATTKTAPRGRGGMVTAR